PEAGRVRRADVDRHVVGDRRHRPQAADIIGDAVRTLLVGADIDANDALAVAALQQALKRRRLTAIVEAHAVDDRAVLAEAKQARLRIPLLRAWGQRSHLDEPEAQAEHLLGHFRILVETG